MVLMERARLMRNQKMFAWFNEILNNGGNSIQYALIKGDLLSNLAYGKLNCRSYNDIDIIVHRKNLKKLEKVFDSRGFLYYNM